MIPKAMLDHWITVMTNVGVHALYALVIFFVGSWLAKRFSRFNLQLLKKRKVDATVAQFINRMLHYVIMLLVVMAVLAQLGVETSSLLAIMGGMSLALGLALRSSISNVASGMLLIIFRPFKVGDSIQVNSFTGTVLDIQILFTKIRTAQYQEITIPNDQFMKSAVMNYSKNEKRRADIVVGIGYDDDIKQAKEIIESILTADARVLSEPPPIIAVKELADSSVNILARFFTDKSDYWASVFEFNEQVKLQMDAAGISIPYPQQDVHLHSVDGALAK
jgi:small conductance mechanosensitive channel